MKEFCPITVKQRLYARNLARIIESDAEMSPGECEISALLVRTYGTSIARSKGRPRRDAVEREVSYAASCARAAKALEERRRIDPSDRSAAVEALMAASRLIGRRPGAKSRPPELPWDVGLVAAIAIADGSKSYSKIVDELTATYGVDRRTVERHLNRSLDPAVNLMTGLIRS